MKTPDFPVPLLLSSTFSCGSFFCSFPSLYPYSLQYFFFFSTVVLFLLFLCSAPILFHPTAVTRPSMRGQHRPIWYALFSLNQITTTTSATATTHGRQCLKKFEHTYWSNLKFSRSPGGPLGGVTRQLSVTRKELKAGILTDSQRQTRNR